MPKIILLADDSITIQKVVELTFSDGDYQVVATNNGNKAIQKLGELRPDIILSDIIMPEKNGYELCEYVKSHPDYRSIPVILLTGTFEPFDPDRAEKAGCDAVITKPFESQSLIHKVEELIEQSAASRSGAAKSSAAEPAPSPTTSAAPPAASPAGFSTAEDEKDTGAWPKSKGEAGGWGGSSSPSGFSAPSSFSSASPTQPVTPPPAAKSGFGDEVFGGSSASEPAKESIEYGDQTKTLPKFSFDDRPREEPPAEQSSESEVDYSGATKAFPKMSFDDLKKAAGETPSSSSKESSWTSPSQAEPASDWASPSKESAPFGDEPSASSPQASAPLFGGDDQEDSWAASPAAKSDSRATESQAAASSSPATPPAASAGGELSKEQIDQIARRVVELMSEQLVKSIAWEVIPDLAEMVVRERIKQLESEA